MFTQPLMYQRIKQTKPILDQYQKKIIGEGVADEKYVKVGDTYYDKYNYTLIVKEELSKYGSILEDAYKSSKEITSVRNRDWLDSPWDDFFRGKDPNQL